MPSSPMACNDRDSNNRDHTPSRSHYDTSFSVFSVQSSAKKAPSSSIFSGAPIPFCLDKNDKPSSMASVGPSYLGPLSGHSDILQSKIEHLERERVELTMQLHRKDEKDRDRKLRLEQLEFKLQSAEEERGKASNDAADLRDQVYRLQNEKDDLSQDIQRLQRELQNSNRCEAMDVWKKMTATARELKRVEEELAQATNERMALQHEHQVLVEEVENLKKVIVGQDADLAAARQQAMTAAEDHVELVAALEQRLAQAGSDLQSQREQQLAQESEYLSRIAELQAAAEELESQTQVQTQALALAASAPTAPVVAMSSEITEAYEKQLADLREKLQDSDRKRRELHNQVQDLKGHVRVFIRCRPLLAADQEADATASLVTLHQDLSTVTVSGQATNSAGGARSVQHNFSFDHTFGGSSTQDEVFEEVSGLVQSVLDGFRVCVFSYGQTGSGKTHTMTGSMAGGQRGIIPRALEQVLRQAGDLQAKGWTVQAQLSVLEIYNEDIRDLLAGYANVIPSASTSSKGIKIFRHPQTNRVIINGLASFELPVTTATQDLTDSCPGFEVFQKLFEFAVHARSTAHTGMNSTSSRSHFMVMVDVQATSPASTATPSITLQGGLRLCDLAGSERLDRANTLGDATRLKETVHINKSLSCLADVFLALSHKASHVPYRNSKLTTLLQDCLSGDGKAMMFVNISPTVLSTQETLCSLRFASQVSQVELGKAQKSIFAAVPPQPLQPQPSDALGTSGPTRAIVTVAQMAEESPMPPPAPARTAVRFGDSAEASPLRSAGKGKSRSRSPVPRGPAAQAQSQAAAPLACEMDDDELPPAGLNRPLPMASFLSAGSGRVLGGPAVRGGVVVSGASRRASVLRPPPPSLIPSTSAVSSAGEPFSLLAQAGKAGVVGALVCGGDKENEANAGAYKPSLLLQPRGLLAAAKRELPAAALVPVESSKRARTAAKSTWR